MAMTLRFEIFPDDLDETVAFYTQVLGFEITADRRHERSPYVSLRRDEVRVGALQQRGPWQRDHRRPPLGVELVLEVDDLQGELERVRASGWPVEEDLEERPWGLSDFRILDPSGYYLRITDRRPRDP